MGRIKVGISSWTEPTLVKSGWYPRTATTAEDRLRYYASKFPIVEIDSTFYAIPNAKTAQLWVERTPKDFTFNAKAYALLTQHPAPAARLPKDLREKVSDSKRTCTSRTWARRKRKACGIASAKVCSPCRMRASSGRLSSSFRSGSCHHRPPIGSSRICANGCPTLRSRSNFGRRCG